MSSHFYDIPGSHEPFITETVDTERTGLVSHKHKHATYFSYEDIASSKKVSSKYDPENPNRDKLGTYDGVFVPTALNVLSILMFLRFGFILGQLGVICTLGLLLSSYTINLLTTLSISAISTNGTIRGGGAYYMISRCLGPEFGGSIGLVFFLGQVFNSGMNTVGIVEPLLYNFGAASASQNISSGVIFGILPRGQWYEFAYASIILLICIGIALIGSQTVSKAGNFLFIALMISIVSIPMSGLLKYPFNNDTISYTGPSWVTFKGNLLPHFTKHAAGSVKHGKETFNSLFGIFFPATAGIFAGAGMSSELRKPSKSIPKGTLWGLIFTFVCYGTVVISMSCTIPRETLYSDVQVIQSVSGIPWIIFLGEMSTSLFSVIVGMVGAAYVLEAIAKDNVLPILSIFARNSNYPLLFTWFITQACLFSDVNDIASLITMTFLMTFVVMNLACFLLKISSAPNFRPSFRYFNKWTAMIGTLISTLAMFVVDGVAACGVILAMVILFVIIHYTCPPKSWGDVSQTLIYHQVRKYLFRLKQDNIKYWRPQVLLFVDNPSTSWPLILFCNHLKKGGLYILGHVTVTSNGSFQDNFDEVKRQQAAWVQLRDIAQIKAFVQVGSGSSLPWGVRNVFLGSGLGGMKPNITILGFFDLDRYLHGTNDGKTPRPPLLHRELPTDNCKNEQKITYAQWVEIIEDLALMKSNIAVAHGFRDLQLPIPESTPGLPKKYIDLYPLHIASATGTANFDTSNLILQLAAILTTVPEWRQTHVLRVILVVDQNEHRETEYHRMWQLLQLLRIDAHVLSVSLSDFRTYRTIVNGVATPSQPYVDAMMHIAQNRPRHAAVFRSSKLPSTRILEAGTGAGPTLVPVEVPPGTSVGGKETGFNALSRLQQYIILNDVMSQLSAAPRTALVLVPLPLPPTRTHRDNAASLAYIQDMHVWLDSLPPTLLVNAQTITVTTAL